MIRKFYDRWTKKTAASTGYFNFNTRGRIKCPFTTFWKVNRNLRMDIFEVEAYRKRASSLI